jgi:UDP-N-acetylmuramoyl-L-alanyl-D-glutamate--2,6-diaminopimelate ligase
MREHSQLAAGVSLKRLYPAAEFLNARDISVSSCTSDSRQCRPGDVFVALVGDNHDGHDFARPAMERGAVGIVAEYPVPVDGLPQCIVPDTRIAFATLCQRLAGDPSKRLKVIGVTGTAGKTSVSTLVASALAHAGHRVALLNDLEQSDWETLRPATGNEHGSAEIADWLARAVSNDCAYAVVEVSSQALARRRFHGVEFDTVCVTNIQRAHLREHGTLANYVRCKHRILELMRPDGVVVANADDLGAKRLLNHWNGPGLTFGGGDEAEIQGALAERCPSEQTFLLTAGHETVPVRTSIVGDHHLSNCLAAVTVGLAHGLRVTDAVAGVEAVTSLPGRLERLECGQPFGVFLDQYCFEGSLVSCLQTLRGVTRGRLICILGAMPQQSSKELAHWTGLAGKDADEVILTSDNFKTDAPERKLGSIAGRNGEGVRTRVIGKRTLAVSRIFAELHEGDCVLVTSPRSNHAASPWQDRAETAHLEELLRRQFRSTWDEPIVQTAGIPAG